MEMQNTQNAKNSDFNNRNKTEGLSITQLQKSFYIETVLGKESIDTSKEGIRNQRSMHTQGQLIFIHQRSKGSITKPRLYVKRMQ